MHPLFRAGGVLIVFSTFGACVAAALIVARSGASADLMATWLAGVFYASGDFTQIYPADATVFTMRPPEEWRPYMAEQGYDGAIYPYLYPPLWAALMSKAVHLTDFASFARGVGVANTLLIVATAFLAWRAARSTYGALGHVTLVLVMTLTGIIGIVALFENQPQILVSFLLVFAIERERAGALVAAGALLALAAALKVYPALFAMLWLMTGQRRALGAFVVVGGALAGLSVLLAGWPLHAEFLRSLSVVSQTALVNGLAFSLDALLANLGLDGPLTFIAAHNDTTGEIGWRVVEKSPLRVWLSRALILAVLIGLGWAMRRADTATTYTILWPLALLSVSLFGPITWAYSYLPVLAFLPALRDRFGFGLGVAVSLAVALPFFYPIWAAWPNYIGEASVRQILGTVVMATLGLVLWRAARAPRAVARPLDSSPLAA